MKLGYNTLYDQAAMNGELNNVAFEAPCFRRADAKNLS